jgi:hypothetical protein
MEDELPKIPREHLPLFERLKLDLMEGKKPKEAKKKPEKVASLPKKEEDIPQIAYIKIPKIAQKEPKKELKDKKIYIEKGVPPFSRSEMEQAKELFWNYFKIAILFLGIVWFLGLSILIVGGSCG